jgi:hypothetical protein
MATDGGSMTEAIGILKELLHKERVAACQERPDDQVNLAARLFDRAAHPVRQGPMHARTRESRETKAAAVSSRAGTSGIKSSGGVSSIGQLMINSRSATATETGSPATEIRTGASPRTASERVTLGPLTLARALAREAPLTPIPLQSRDFSGRDI